MTTSAPTSALSKSVKGVTPIRSTALGISVEGAQTRTSAASAHVAADHDALAGDAAAAAADGQRVEQCLRRMFVAPVAGRLRGVDQRFALLHARLRGMHVDDVRAQALARDFEAQQRARAVFEEGVDLREAVEAFVGRRMVAVRGDPRFRLVEQKGDLMRLEAVDAGQVPVRENGAARKLGGGAVIGGLHQVARNLVAVGLAAVVVGDDDDASSHGSDRQNGDQDAATGQLVLLARHRTGADRLGDRQARRRVRRSGNRRSNSHRRGRSGHQILPKTHKNSLFMFVTVALP
ncbi:hypothetical protein WR25_06043 [Diploscapter pachys]|uniref:Uncharacterized protein n=1 Tax=Diploscapter pachys TaxID=2018661 RepID=A0A2A2K0U3_9BILA|nr:hypothetical protein WR25_06043 [Diploscapter pachys]